MMDVFHELGLKAVNAGACSGQGRWASTTTEGLLDSVNPATGQVLAQVNRCSGKDYDLLVQESQRAYREWRQVPAPKRGEVVRLIGEALRAKKNALGSLVS
ncbi:MAG TPA: aldehyde dehydrogenase family protein, partial [Nitrospiraceae bacterium]|nr:aldehyde dehydrogenase family protein [Nitrospiraceae bacterium]